MALARPVFDFGSPNLAWTPPLARTKSLRNFFFEILKILLNKPHRTLLCANTLFSPLATCSPTKFYASPERANHWLLPMRKSFAALVNSARYGRFCVLYLYKSPYVVKIFKFPQAKVHIDVKSNIKGGL